MVVLFKADTQTTFVLLFANDRNVEIANSKWAYENLIPKIFR